MISQSGVFHPIYGGWAVPGREKTAESLLIRVFPLIRGSPSRHHEGHCIIPRMGEADGELGQAQLLGPRPGPPVQINQGFTPFITEDLHLSPGDAPQPGAQGFGDRLFGSETDRQLRRPPSAISLLRRGVHSLKETLAVPPQNGLDALDLNDVYPNGEKAR